MNDYKTSETLYQCQNPLMSATPTTKFTNICTKCKEVLREGVEYRNTVWHRECLTCSNCTSMLAGTQFTHINDKPYCFHCYGQLYAHKCAACMQPIYGLGDGFLVYMEGHRWHIGCFQCSSCATPLLGESSFYSDEGAMCSNCTHGEDTWL